MCPLPHKAYQDWVLTPWHCGTLCRVSLRGSAGQPGGLTSMVGNRVTEAFFLG